MNLQIRCQVNLVDGWCGGPNFYHAGNSVIGQRFALCAGYPSARHDAFVSDSGDCVVEGDCVSSPFFPNNYKSGDNCFITTLRAGILGVSHFNTQANRDVFALHGMVYSGFKGPDGVAVGIGEKISWRTDSTVTDNGWKVCLRERLVENGPGHAMVVIAVGTLVLLGVTFLSWFYASKTMPGKMKLRGLLPASIAEPLLGPELAGAVHDVAFEPCAYVFDYHAEHGRQLRCLRVEVPSRCTLDNSTSVHSEVLLEYSDTGTTSIRIRLSKKSDLPSSAAFVEPHVGAQLPCLALMSGTWEKTYNFTGLWDLYEPMDSNGQNIDLHGVLQVHFAPMARPSAKLRKSFVVESVPCQRFDTASTPVASDIGPSASAVGEPVDPESLAASAHERDAQPVNWMRGHFVDASQAQEDVEELAEASIDADCASSANCSSYVLP